MARNMKARSEYRMTAEPSDVRAWREYANAEMRRLTERTKNSIHLDNSIPVKIKKGQVPA